MNRVAFYDSRDKKCRAAGKLRKASRGRRQRSYSTYQTHCLPACAYAGHACASIHIHAGRTHEYIIRAQNQWRSRGWNTTRRREIAFALSVNPIARVAEAHPGHVIKPIITPSRGYLVLAVNLGANRRRHRRSNGIRLNAITAAAASHTAY